MAEGIASLVQFYAREGAGGAISLEKRVEASWNAACPGQEILAYNSEVGTQGLNVSRFGAGSGGDGGVWVSQIVIRMMSQWSGYYFTW